MHQAVKRGRSTDSVPPDGDNTLQTLGMSDNEALRSASYDHSTPRLGEEPSIAVGDAANTNSIISEENSACYEQTPANKNKRHHQSKPIDSRSKRKIKKRADYSPMVSNVESGGSD